VNGPVQDQHDEQHEFFFDRQNPGTRAELKCSNQKGCTHSLISFALQNSIDSPSAAFPLWRLFKVAARSFYSI
jgi:hypothetical protein